MARRLKHINYVINCFNCNCL